MAQHRISITVKIQNSCCAGGILLSPLLAPHFVRIDNLVQLQAASGPFGMAAQLGKARSTLASLAGRVRSAVQPATSLVEKEVVDRYTKLIEANKEYVVKDQAAADKLMKQWFFTKLAR